MIVDPGPARQGTVERFDDDAGLGELSTPEGERYPFHCTAITDGSRTIEVGRTVAFVIGAGGPGRWEARSVRPLDPTTPTPTS